jgi:hypothetical protein
MTEVAPEATEEAPVVSAEVTPEVTPEEVVPTPETPAVEETPEVTEEETPEVPEGYFPEGFSAYTEQFEADGTLSEENYTSLAAQGFSKEVVDAYIEGATSDLQEADQEALITGAGGTEHFNTMKEWAGANLPKEQLEQFNKGVSKKASSQMAVEWLQMKYEASEGKPPSVVVQGETPPSKGPDVYANEDQIVRAIRDPRYKTDATYRNAVMAKVGRSPTF